MDVATLALRVVSFVAGGGLVSAVFLRAATTNPEGALLLGTSVVGVLGAMAVHWAYFRSGSAPELRWYRTLGLAVSGAILAHAALGLASTTGSLAGILFALGASVRVGLLHGLVFGVAVVLMLVGLRGPVRPFPLPDLRGKLREWRKVRGGASQESPPPTVPGGPAPASAGDDPTAPGSRPKRSRMRRIAEGLLGGTLLLALCLVPLALAGDPTVFVVFMPPVVFMVVASLVIWTWRRGRPLQSRHILVQLSTVVVLVMSGGWTLLFLVSDPVATIAYLLGVGGAMTLILRSLDARG